MPTPLSTVGVTKSIQEVSRKHPILAVYLFGSHARGKADAESDIDLGVVLDATMPAMQRGELRLRLMREFAEALSVPIEKLDIVPLRDATTLLRYNAVRQGRVVFERDVTERRSFELSVERAYDDEAATLDREADVTFDRILSRAK